MRANAWAVTIHEVEHAWRDAGFMHDFGEDHRVQRRDFRWLQDHCATGCDGRGDFTGDLVERPIPRCDETANADWLFAEQGRAALLFKLIVAQNLAHGCHMTHSGWDLSSVRQPHRRAHLVGDCFRHVAHARLETRHDFVEQVSAILYAGL